MTSLYKSITKKVKKPFEYFLKLKSESGFVLLFSTLLALLLANSPIGLPLENILNYEFHILPQIHFSILHIINDVLMTFFFFLVGSEIKREISHGELSSFKKAILPIIAAFGGIIGPAIIYTICTYGTSFQKGWAIPTATDIAFSLTILTLLKNRVPHALRIFLASLAITDDLVAILIIAFFYSSNIDFNFVIMIFLSSASWWFIMKKFPHNWYIFISGAILIWFLTLKSGIHPTVSGVILAFLAPNQKSKTKEGLSDIAINHIEEVVLFVVMPLFAFANALIIISPELLVSLKESLSLGIILGLCLGKSIGIFGFTFLATKLKIGNKSSTFTWKQLYAVAWIAGIGFTMSIFTSQLTFNNNVFLLNTAKLAVLIGSLLSGLVGYYLMKIFTKEVVKESKKTLLKDKSIE